MSVPLKLCMSATFMLGFSSSGSVARRGVVIHAPGDTIYELYGTPAASNCTALKTLQQTATTHC